MSIPFIFTWKTEELFEFNKMLFVYALSAILLGLHFAKMILKKRIIFRKNFFDLAIIIFLVSQILSTIFSIHPYTSIFGYYSRFHGGLLSTLSYTALYFVFVNNVKKKELWQFLLTLIISTSLASLYAIPEHFGHSFSCLMIGTGFNVSCWVQDVQNRIFGSFGQPNWLAAYLVTLLPIYYFFIIKPKFLKKILPKLKYPIIKLVTSASCLLPIIAILFTKSRSGLLAFGASTVVFLLGLVIINQTSKKSSRLTKLTQTLFQLISNIQYQASSFWLLPASRSLGEGWASGFLTVLLVFSTFTLGFFLNQTDLSQRITPQNSGGTDSGLIRQIVWQGAFHVWQRYPLLGSGVETFAYSYYQDRPISHNLVSEWDFLYNKAHNEFLNILATTGIVGLAAYCFLISNFLSFATLQIFDKKKNQEQRLLSLSLLSGFIALNISNFFGFSTVSVGTLFFIFPAFITIENRESDVENRGSSKIPSLIQTLALFSLFLVTITVLQSIYQIWLADLSFARAKKLKAQGQLEVGIRELLIASKLRPAEALYYNELARSYAELSLAHAQNEAASQEELEQAVLSALTASELTLRYNSVHLPFLKSQALMYIDLSTLNPDFLTDAEKILEQAIQLSPTDPKLRYQLAIIAFGLEKNDKGFEFLQQAIELRPNYGKARLVLADKLAEKDKVNEARAEYQYILDHISPDDELVKKKLNSLLQKDPEPSSG